MKYAAKKLLASAGYLYHKGNGGMMNERVRKLTAFLGKNCKGIDDALTNVKIETNNNNETCTKHNICVAFTNIGSVSGKYQLWAVIRK